MSDDVRQLAEAAADCDRLRRRIARTIVGQDEVVTALLAAVLADGHTLLVGVPGLAKTLLVKTLAGALGLDWNRVQFTPDLMPTDLIGTELLQPDDAGRRALTFAPGPVFTHLLLADEINRTPPRTQAALLEAMQERQVTSAGRRPPLAPPFLVVATQNPIEQEGTYPLPEAQLDRFMLSLPLDYPSAEEEERIVTQTTQPVADEDGVTQDDDGGLGAERLRALQALVRRVPAAPAAVRFAVSLTRSTRPKAAGADALVEEHVAWGAGPRAGQHLVLLAKALAVMAGDPAVDLGHLRRAAPHVLRHRVLPHYDAVGRGVTADDIVQHLLDRTPSPA
jgi:MoxR-like ATPase